MRLIYVFACLALLSCGNNDGSGKFAEEALEVADANAGAMNLKVARLEAPVQPVTERKIIKTGDLTFETGDVKKTKASVEAITKALGGYISNENQNNFGDRLQFNQTIRIPAQKFDTLLQYLEACAKQVQSRNINTQDVTEEFIDVEARLMTKKELEARYREILKQAKSVEDIISIENQIANVRAEIESMEGRLNYLKNQVSYSTLHVSYVEHIGTDFGFASKFVRALSQGWDNLLAFLIFAVNLWPFILVVAASVWGGLYWQKKKREHSKRQN